MAFDSVPWFIGGGAEHSPAVARMLAYAATNGATGVISPGDLKVTALPTPGAAVRIMPGGAAMLSRYPGASNQSYTPRNPTATDVDVTATGSGGGATKYLIVRVDDPEFGGQVPADRKNGPYVRPVWVNSITNLEYPFLKLSKLVQPANTATITNAMLTDIREVANPRTQRELYLGPATVQNLTSSTFVKWPSYEVNVPVPDWANWVKIIAHVNGAQQMTGKTYGEVRLNFGATLQSGNTAYDINSAASVNDGARLSTIGVVLSAALPANYRGNPQALRVMANKGGGAVDPGYLRADGATHIEYDVWFQEVAD